MVSHHFFAIKRIFLYVFMEQVSVKESKTSKDKKLNYYQKNVPSFFEVSYDI